MMDSEQKPKSNIESMVESVEHSPQLLEVRRRNIMRFVYQRLIAGPGGSIVLHVILIVLILKMATGTTTDSQHSVAVTIIQPKTVDVPESKVEDILKTIEQKPPEVPETPIEDNLRPVLSDQPMIGETVSSESQGSGSEADSAGLGSGSGSDAGFEISVVRSPVVIRGLYASRTAGGRKAALAKFGGGGGVAEGVTETAVLRALRWLKKYQEPDGSWTQASGGAPDEKAGAVPAMTGFALLAFLAHGETPASEEFGDTVERAIKWLIQDQKPDGRFKLSDGNEYSLPIASYALCEAYSLTHIPMIKDAATKSTEVLIKGQNVNGFLWNYKATGGSDRNDLSYAAWCMQALKAAKMAGMGNAGLNDCIKKAIEGLRLNYRPAGEAGGFSYTTGGGPGNLTGAGVLCLQLLGAPNDKKVQAGLLYLEPMTCDWQNPWAGGPLYYWYYATQAKFQAGGSTWNRWNKQFWPQFVKNQIIVPNAIEDLKGNRVDIGYWQSPGKSEHCKSYVYSTALCALSLEVYYRYLPTYHPPADTSSEVTLTVENGVNVDIR